jgi:tetratricopeptide (TPR) repeat protein
MIRALALLSLLSVASPLTAETWLILPFFNLSSDSNLQWIGESLSESVREALAAEGLLVIDREQRDEALRRLSIRSNTQVTTATVMRIGEVLDADQIVYGTFDWKPPAEAGAPKTKGTLRIVARILSLRRARQGPEYTELGALEDMARLQNHLAWQTLQFATPATAPSEEEFRQRYPVIRVDAMESYVRGLLATAADQRLRLLTQAVRLDPRFSQASFQLARLYFEKKSWRPAADLFVRVNPLDTHAREALFYLGICRYRLGEFDGAVEAFKAVTRTVPLNEVWNNLGAAQSRRNDPEALDSFLKAVEGDPADPDYQFNAGYALLRRGEYDKAAERFRAVLERTPDDAEATEMLGRSLRKSAAKPSAASSEGVERLKEEYEESAWLQLKALIEPRKNQDKSPKP